MPVPRTTAVAVGISGLLMFATGAMAMTNVVDLGIGPPPAQTVEDAAPAGVPATGAANPTSPDRADDTAAPAEPAARSAPAVAAAVPVTASRAVATSAMADAPAAPPVTAPPVVSPTPTPTPTPPPVTVVPTPPAACTGAHWEDGHWECEDGDEGEDEDEDD